MTAIKMRVLAIWSGIYRFVSLTELCAVLKIIQEYFTIFPYRVRAVFALANKSPRFCLFSPIGEEMD
jgi:hypothetical protein